MRWDSLTGHGELLNGLSENMESLGMETSISGQWDEFEDLNFLFRQSNVTECGCCDDDVLCESPFRFVLLRSPSSASHTPELASPELSPSHHTTQVRYFLFFLCFLF